MALAKEILQYVDTMANVYAHLDDKMIGALTDQVNELVWRKDSSGLKIHHLAVMKTWNGSAYTYKDAEFSALALHGNLDVAGAIRLASNTSNAITFGATSIGINSGAIDIDTIISANGITNALVVQGSDGAVSASVSLAAPIITAATSDAATNTVVKPLIVQHISSGTANIGFGASVKFKGQRFDTGAALEIGTIEVFQIATNVSAMILSPCYGNNVPVNGLALTAKSVSQVDAVTYGDLDVGIDLRVAGTTSLAGAIISDLLESPTQTHSWTGTDVTVYDIIASFAAVESGEIEIMSQFVNGETIQNQTKVYRYTTIAGAAGVKITAVYDDGDVTGTTNINASVGSGKIQVTHGRGGALGTASVAMWIRCRRFQHAI